MQEDCYANMRLISSIDSFKVYTDNDGFRYSGKKRKPKNKSVVLLGDSQTFGVGSNWNNTFTGILEKEFSEYNFYNLGVPSYSPTIYNYSLNKFIKKEKKEKIEKIFVLIDLTDVGDEANRWQTKHGKPNLKNEKIFYKKNKGFSKFKKENFKGIYLISSKIRSFFRKARKKKDKIKSEYHPVDGNPTGGYIYTDHKTLTGCNNENKRTDWWSCGDIEKGLTKIEDKIIEISKTAKQLKSEFYIIIIPWPDTLNFGQKIFNWEKFNQDLCGKSKCTKLINLFPQFKEIKQEDKNWLKILYLNNDIHLTTKGNSIVANEIKFNAF
ncbi:hypothetical protein N9W54_00195 [bacterium]|nr:hypothetical protein [bacterium]